MPAAIIALLTSLLPLLPDIAAEIQNVIGLIQNKGTGKDTQAAIHALAQSIHDQVVAAEKTSP